MIINLSPRRMDETLAVTRQGNVLHINGEAFDFSRMSDGHSLPATAISSPWFVSEVKNVGGELELTLILPLPANYSPEQAFPASLLDVLDGPVVLPPPLPDAKPWLIETQESAE